MRRLILNIHLVIGLAVGLFVILLGITGSILAFEPELDRWVHRDISYVKPGGRVLSLVEIGDAISHKYPGESVVAFLPSRAPEFPTQVILSRGIISVNPYSGEVLGLRTRGQSFFGVVRALHVRLAMGSIGRAVMDWSAFVTLVSLITGMYLWWPVKRMRIGGAWWSAKFWYDLHSSSGFFFSLPALFLAGTGVILGFGDQATWLLNRVIASSTAGNNERAPIQKADMGGAEISPDRAIAIARAQVPGAVPYRVQMPRYGGLYVVALELPRNRVTGERNSIALDPSTGRIVSEHLASALSLRERLMATNSAIHNGNILGMPSRIVAALASIVLPVQAVSGLLIWLRRKGLLRTR